MKKFIVLYRAPQSFKEGMKGATPKEMKKEMEAWMVWAKNCGSRLVDLGAPLGNAHSISKNMHGPSDSDVVGYSVLQGESMGEIRKLIEGHPHLMMSGSCSIEVHESLPLPGM